MSNTVPRVFNRLRVLPVSFDSRLGRFILGTSQELVAPNGFIKAARLQEDYLDKKAIRKLCLGIVSGEVMVTGPVFHNFIETEQGQAAIHETPKVMFDVYNQLHTKKAPKHTIGGDFGFEARRFREGQVDLSVLGSCACYSPDLYGHIVRENEWETKFAEYSEHNIDYSAQMISLYAGLGHIAAKALDA